jgi:hypothetical protein
MSYHTTEQVLKKARCLAKKIIYLRKRGGIDCNDIDELAQEAQYIELDTKHLEELHAQEPHHDEYR